MALLDVVEVWIIIISTADTAVQHDPTQSDISTADTAVPHDPSAENNSICRRHVMHVCFTFIACGSRP